MTLAPGTRLGPYEILAPLGVGGMGEVWRAADARLQREVALKVLPPAFTEDKDRLARFEREAQLLASLNHPHIAQVYGLEVSGEMRALVLELVEGPTLAERLAPGPMALEEALPIALQIAEALEAAHRKGIVHRDLKPQNVKVSAEGGVKVLDFGLAKALEPPAGVDSAAVTASPTLLNSPTLTAAGTQLGVILGTAAYMAPEQARGGAVDKRADVWSFGVVLYEMLAGGQLFASETVSDTLASVLKGEIDLARLPEATPGEIRRLLRRCLARRPKERLHDIADARLVLQEVVAGTVEPDEPVATAAGVRAPARRTLWLGGAALALAGLALGVWAGARVDRPPQAAPAPVRFSAALPEGVEEIWNVRLAPAGDLLVFQAWSEAGARFFVHRFATGATTDLPNLAGIGSPFLSPDGRWVAFDEAGSLRKQALAGGEPLTICARCDVASGGAWLDDGSILYNRAWLDGLSLVSADGGEPRDLTKPDAARGEKGHWFPRPLPGGRHALFTIFPAGSGINDCWIAVVDVASGEVRRLLQGADAQYQSPGQLVFYRAGAYHAVGFDVATLEVHGEPLRVIDDATELEPQGTASLQLAASVTGTLAYRAGSIADPTGLAWVSAGAEPERLAFPTRSYTEIALAPNGRDAAASALEAGVLVLYHLDLVSGNEERLQLPGSNWDATWRPDGAAIAYTTMRKGDFDVYTLELLGSGGERALLEGPADESIKAWFPGGERVAVEISRPDGYYPLLEVELATGEQRTLVDRPFDPEDVDISPDGRWLLYASRQGARHELYVQPLDREGAAQRVTRRGGTQPRWSPDGGSILYRQGESLFAAPFLARAGRAEIGAERELVEAPIGASSAPLATVDGRRFLVRLRDRPWSPPELRVVLHWNREIAARLEAGR